MSFYYPLAAGAEPTEQNIKQYMSALMSNFGYIEKARWNEAHVNTLFRAGNQNYINNYFRFAPGYNANNFHINLIAQPCNMVTGYQRQNRKSPKFIPISGGDEETTDQYTRLMLNTYNQNGIHYEFSKACDQATTAGKVLVQPYLDFDGDDPAQGELKWKVWEYASFLIDPYYRNQDMSDCQFIWCQEYITQEEAYDRWGERAKNISPMRGGNSVYGQFYFLPESHNLNKNNLYAVSYIWFKSRRKRKKLYSRSRNQFFDISPFADTDKILYQIPDMEEVEIEVPSWKVAVILNDHLMTKSYNPLGVDCAPMYAVDWEYDPHINEAPYRVRSLVSAMRTPQFLMNRQIILSHEQKETTINSGWKRKVGAVANEDNLKKGNNGWDILINEDHEMTDVEKIVPNSVPASDFELSNRMGEFIFQTSGVNMETWNAESNQNVSTLTMMMKQGANLMVLQKYFDQWDYSFKLLSELSLEIALANWNAEKVALKINETPTAFFYSRIFSKYQTVVEEGLNTPTQMQQEYQQTLDLNKELGGIIPPSYLASIATLQGKTKLMRIFEEQEQAQAAQQQMASQTAANMEDAKVQELYSKIASNIAMARERHGRAESNIGLFEERLSEISRNRSLATKDKMEALEKLIEVVNKYGEIETALAGANIENYDYTQARKEDLEKADAKSTALSNEFVQKLLQQTQ